MDYQVIEHNAFATRWFRRADEKQLGELRKLLTENPDLGKPIPGCGVLRKLRIADPGRGKGKRGGMRVIYLHTSEAKRIRLLVVYGKGEKEDLSASELKAVCEAARKLRESDQQWARRAAGGKGKMP
jgi:mRNA-degrading endonuclease RelE of RelBE toxin-antitoxin system